MRIALISARHFKFENKTSYALRIEFPSAGLNLNLHDTPQLGAQEMLLLIDTHSASGKLDELLAPLSTFFVLAGR